MEEFHLPSIPLKKHGHREMSGFIAWELLYDYLSGRLDPERAEAVRKQIEELPSLKKQVQRLHLAEQYAKSLSRLSIPEEAYEKIDEPDTYLSVLLKKTNFERWPLAIRWGVEAAVVLAALMLVLVIMPWNQILNMALSPQGREIILAEAVRPQIPYSEDGLYIGNQDDATRFEDEGVKDPTPTAGEEKPTAVAANTPAKPAEAPAVTPAPAAPAPIPSASAPTVASRTTPPADKAETAEAKKKPAAEGALFRGTLAVTNIAATSPKIVEKIVELGGRKAGQVELGWQKTSTSSYFHFTMPEAKYDELVEFLNTYGDAQIHKEKHPRVMPEGIVRMIIEVEEAEK